MWRSCDDRVQREADAVASLIFRAAARPPMCTMIAVGGVTINEDGFVKARNAKGDVIELEPHGMT
jgi:hypothetical protein